MSYLIVHDCISWQVIGEGGCWLQNPNEALRFKTCDEAVEYCAKHKIENYTLKIKFDDSDGDRRNAPTLCTLMTFYASDAACALHGFCNSFASAA